MKKALSIVALFVVLFAGCGGEVTYTEKEAREKFENERISLLEKENTDLRGQLVSSQSETVSAEKKILELKLKNARQEAEVALNKEVIAKVESEKESLRLREVAVSTKEGGLSAREAVLKTAEAKIESWNRNVSEVKGAFSDFKLSVDGALRELLAMEGDLLEAQQMFARIKNSPNIPANRQRI